MTQDRLSSILNREAMRGVKASGAVDLTALATTNIVNVSGRGVLESVGIVIRTPVTGSPVVTLRVTIDGGTPMDMLIYNGSLSPHADLSGYIQTYSDSTANLNTFDNAGSALHIPLNLPHNVSALVAVIVGTAASAGAIDVSAIDKVPV